MNAFLLVRDANMLLAAWSVLGYLYIDRLAFAEWRQGGMTRGQLISRMGRVIFLAASANATIDAIIHHRPGGQQVMWIFVGLVWVAIGTTWMALDAWHLRHPKRAEI